MFLSFSCCCNSSLDNINNEYIDKHFHKPITEKKFLKNGTCIYFIKRTTAQNICKIIYKNNIIDLNLNIVAAEGIYTRFTDNTFYFPLFTYKLLPSYIRNRHVSDTRISDASIHFVKKMKENFIQ